MTMDLAAYGGWIDHPPWLQRTCGKRHRTTRLSPRELVQYGRSCAKMHITRSRAGLRAPVTRK